LRDAIERGLEGFEYDGLVYLNPTIHPTTDYDPSKGMNVPTMEQVKKQISDSIKVSTDEEVMAGYQNPEYMNDYEAN
jgi:hypothetical protein